MNIIQNIKSAQLSKLTGVLRMTSVHISFFLLSSARHILKAKYTIRCSVKSSTAYIKNLVLYMHFFFQNDQNSVRPVFDSSNKIIFSYTTSWFFLFHLCIT